MITLCSGDNAIRRTDDGFEVTVGTNHLGHFLLTNMLLPDLEAAGADEVAGVGPRIVITASEVHDPASPGEGGEATMLTHDAYPTL